MKKHTNTPRLLLFLALLLLSQMGYAQPICQIKHFSVYTGLAQRTVSNIVQDPKGFVWFATWNGLNKFDGYSFKNYKAYPGDGCTLTSNRLLLIVQNQHCDIWCQTYDNRVYLFDTRQEKFIDILHPFEEKNNTSYIVSKVYSLPKGISWIVCEQGAFRVEEHLCKEENANFEEHVTFYSFESGNLPGQQITDIQQDAHGDEWILTDKGTIIIGKKKITTPEKFKSNSENNGKMYLISANNQLKAYHFDKQKIESIALPCKDTRLNVVKSLGKDTIVIGTDRGIILYYEPTKTFKVIDLQSPPHPFKVIKIFKDSHRELWLFSSSTGVVRCNPANGEEQYYQTPQEDMPKAERQSIDLIFEDSQETLWVVPTDGCLGYYDRKSKELKPYFADYNNPESKFSPVILTYYLDNQKNFWFANTFDMGKISFFPNACQQTPFDSGFETRAFLVDQDKCLWAANKKGFIRIFNSDRSLKGYLSAEGNISTTPVSFSRNIYCFMEDENGDIWLGGKWDGLFRLRRKSDKQYEIKRYTHDKANIYSLNHNSIYSIYQDSQKRIWVGTHGGGLNLLQTLPNGKEQFLHRDNLLKGLPKDKFSKVRIIQEVGDAILVGTTEGLLSFACAFNNAEEIKFNQNSRKPTQASSLSSNDVTCIYTDHRKNTFVLTFAGGVNQVLSKNLLTDSIQFKPYTRQNGLSSDLVLAMIEDKQKNLWVIAENALAKFNPETGTFDNYDEKYLQKETYFSEAIPVLMNDLLILGTEAGVLKINPMAFRKSTYTPPIVFTGLRIQGIQQNMDIDDLAVLELKPDERNVTFEFAALDYIDPASISYAYRLKGLEEQWNEVDNNRRASYINLPHGNYELQIRSTNSDGVWTENTRSLPIVVIPTFKETYWAMLLYIVLFVLFTATIVYIIIYIYKLRHQINLEQQLANIKLRFFTDISHELRTPLTLITSPVSEVLEHEPLSVDARKHLSLVQKNTERMLRLINQILDFRKIENKKMKLLLENTEIIALLNQVMDNFRLIAEEKKINFCLQTDLKSIHAWIDQDKFEKIIFNLLSNAFKYTPDNKSIIVYAHVENNRLIVSITDEGIGIDLKKRQNLFQRFETLVQSNILQPSSGIGLSLVKELIELHQGNIQVNSETGIGSEFIVSFPLDRNAYRGKENTEFILNDAAQSNSANHNIQSPRETGNSAPLPETPVGNEGEPDSVTILIVEDNTELRGFLTDILSATYTIIEATNGQEGLKHATEHQPDLIISDIMMPIMDGLDMVKAIKSNRDICHIPIVLLSAKSSLDDRISGLEQGIDDYITKPFSSTYLKTRIKSLLQQRRMLQDIYLREWSDKLNHQPEEVHTAIEPVKPPINSFDEQFMQQVLTVVEKQMDNSEFTIDEFAHELKLGRTVFYQKLKSIIGLSPVDFLREIRIKRAMQLIEIGEHNISTIAYMTGFNDPKYFSKCFKKKFGINPSECFNARKEQNEQAKK